MAYHVFYLPFGRQVSFGSEVGRGALGISSTEVSELLSVVLKLKSMASSELDLRERFADIGELKCSALRLRFSRRWSKATGVSVSLPGDFERARGVGDGTGIVRNSMFTI